MCILISEQLSERDDLHDAHESQKLVICSLSSLLKAVSSVGRLFYYFSSHSLSKIVSDIRHCYCTELNKKRNSESKPLLTKWYARLIRADISHAVFCNSNRFVLCVCMIYDFIVAIDYTDNHSLLTPCSKRCCSQYIFVEDGSLKTLLSLSYP